jgi:hypothetical protein
MCQLGHRGREGNEEAGKLAKKGANTPFIGPQPVCGISKSTAKTAGYQWARKEHKKRWLNFPGQKLGKTLVKASSNTLTNALIQRNRRQIRSAIGIVTGHGRFRKHLQHMGLFHDDAICRLCGQFEGTAKHILLEYEVTAWLRALAAELYDIGIQNLVPRLNKCRDKDGDYVEK